MTQRVTKLIIVLVVLLVVGGIFSAVYKLYWESKIQNYAYSLDTCQQLSEERCLENSKCQPVYKLSSGENNILVFGTCSALTDNSKQKLNDAQALCQKTGGEWTRLKTGSYCNCSVVGVGVTWNKDKGCQ